MKRQPINKERAERIIRSYSLIKALAKCIEFTWYNECDADFKSPIIHAHVSQVLRSANAIEQATSAIVMTAPGNAERGQAYIAELLKLLDFTLETMPLDVLMAYNEGLRNLNTAELLQQ